MILIIKTKETLAKTQPSHHFKKRKGGHEPEILQRNNLQIENKRQQVFVILQDEKFIGNSSRGF